MSYHRIANGLGFEFSGINIGYHNRLAFPGFNSIRKKGNKISFTMSGFSPTLDTMPYITRFKYS